MDISIDNVSRAQEMEMCPASVGTFVAHPFSRTNVQSSVHCVRSGLNAAPVNFFKVLIPMYLC